MESRLNQQGYEKTIGLGLLLTTICITPMLSMDPINPPKFLSLIIFAFLIGGQLLFSSNKKELMVSRNFFVISLTMMLLIILNLFLTGGDFWTKFYGVSGRNTGALTYLSLCIFLLGSFVSAIDSDLSKLTKYVTVTGVISLVYSFIQALGIDPFNWVNPYSPVFGFLGNPNFHSSFMAMIGVGSFSHAIIKKITNTQRLIYFLITFLCLVSVYTTKSQQGFLVYGAGIVLPIYLATRGRVKRIQLLLGIATVCATGIFTLLGMLQIGPLTKFLYKESVTYRGDYWQAGWKMATENPLFGIGFDQYGLWYRRTRSIEATLRRGPEFTSNAAHNVLIDFAASGGFLMLTVYLVIVGFTINAIINICRDHNLENQFIPGLIGMWIAYQAQSIISINQIGLAIWGWVLSGTIIGFSFKNSGNSRSVKNNFNTGHKILKNGRQQLTASMFLFSFLFSSVGALIAGPIMLNSMRYKDALESADQSKIVAASHYFPIDETRMGEIAILLTQNKLDAEALVLAQEITARFPDSFQAWRLISQLSTSTDDDKVEAVQEMKRLDPNNPDLKK